MLIDDDPEVKNKGNKPPLIYGRGKNQGKKPSTNYYTSRSTFSQSCCAALYVNKLQLATEIPAVTRFPMYITVETSHIFEVWNN